MNMEPPWTVYLLTFPMSDVQVSSSKEKVVANSRTCKKKIELQSQASLIHKIPGVWRQALASALHFRTVGVARQMEGVFRMPHLCWQIVDPSL